MPSDIEEDETQHTNIATPMRTRNALIPLQRAMFSISKIQESILRSL